jgi:hypothetical protein
MSDEPKIPQDAIDRARQLFIDMGATRDGRTAEHWTDDEVVAQFGATVKVIVEFARKFRRAMMRGLVQINQHLLTTPVPRQLMPYLADGGHVKRMRS